MKILIAEDNAVNRELLRELLEMRGYEVFEACNGQEALDMIGPILPDLLVLDLGMPVLDGFGAIQKIRATPEFAQLPVLAATAYAMRGDRDRVLEAGFDGYVSKPIDPKTLNQEIDRLIGARKAGAAATGTANSG
jgi:two-component system cell cycle response regulator DivK